MFSLTVTKPEQSNITFACMSATTCSYSYDADDMWFTTQATLQNYSRGVTFTFPHMGPMDTFPHKIHRISKCSIQIFRKSKHLYRVQAHAARLLCWQTPITSPKCCQSLDKNPVLCIQHPWKFYSIRTTEIAKLLEVTVPKKIWQRKNSKTPRKALNKTTMCDIGCIFT